MMYIGCLFHMFKPHIRVRLNILFLVLCRLKELS